MTKNKFSLIVLAIIFSTATSFAQNLKFGHVNSQEILMLMPESDSAKISLQNHTKELSSQLEYMQVEFNKKYDEYLTKRETFSALIRQTKETELQEMQQRIQTFQQNAEQSLQLKREELFKPINDKLSAAIQKVGSVNKFIYIFDISYNTIAYKSELSSDVADLVKKELGIK